MNLQTFMLSIKLNYILILYSISFAKYVLVVALPTSVIKTTMKKVHKKVRKKQNIIWLLIFFTPGNKRFSARKIVIKDEKQLI